MKRMMKLWMSGVIALVIQAQTIQAQKIDEERMKRDIEVAENVLSTLLKQELVRQRSYWGMDVKGTYQEGYGVTFRLPGEYNIPLVVTGTGIRGNIIYSDGVTIERREAPPVKEVPEVPEPREAPEKTEPRERKERKERVEIGKTDKLQEKEDKFRAKEEAYQLKEKAKTRKQEVRDSLLTEYNTRMVKVAKEFIVDYGDFISQLGPGERIVVTNQGENRYYYGINDGRRTHISVEGSKADIAAYKQGKLSRDQMMAQLKVVNTETVEAKEVDLELFASIIGRLYRSDLSKTYFSESSLYYERMKDYGVIYYMPVYSSNERDPDSFSMPTLALDDVDKKTRDKKIVELYPKFEQELKENILEYGRTLKSLKDEELLIVNVTMTKCKIPGCGIPRSLELSIKASALRDLGNGKIDKNAALAKFTIKKGPNQ